MQVNASFHHKDRENLPPLSGAAPSWWEEHRIGTGSPTGWHPRTYDPGVGMHGEQNESRCTVWLMLPSRYFYRPKTTCRPAQTLHSSTKYITVQALNTVWGLGTRTVMLPFLIVNFHVDMLSNWFEVLYSRLTCFLTHFEALTMTFPPPRFLHLSTGSINTWTRHRQTQNINPTNGGLRQTLNMSLT